MSFCRTPTLAKSLGKQPREAKAWTHTKFQVEKCLTTRYSQYSRVSDCSGYTFGIAYMSSLISTIPWVISNLLG